MQSSPEILHRLSQLEIFSDFANDTLENNRRLECICHLLEEKSFKKDEIIIHEGDEGAILYILQEGAVQVRRLTPSHDEFAVVNLSAEQNVFFGEIALIDNDKRSASVLALSDCRTLTLTGTDFLELCESDPILGYRVIFRIAKRLSASLRRSTMDIFAIYQALLDEVENRI